MPKIKKMRKNQIRNFEPEENDSSDDKQLSSEEEEDDDDDEEQEEPRSKGKQGISDYEKQRLARIAENRARMEALGLSKMASSLMGSSQSSRKHKGKGKAVQEDEDYRPDDDDHQRDDALEVSEEEYDDEDEDFLAAKTSWSRKTKIKNKGPKLMRTAPVKKHLSSSDNVDDDKELLKAIALSLQDDANKSASAQRDVPESMLLERKGITRMKRKKSFTSRQQMTEDEMVIHFFQFDEAEKGCITARDIQKVALAHDFDWTDKELASMTKCFDSDGDGKLSLDDFRKIVGRCNMLENS